MFISENILIIKREMETGKEINWNFGTENIVQNKVLNDQLQ